MTTGELSAERRRIAFLHDRLDRERAAAQAGLDAALRDPHEQRWHREVTVRTLSEQVNRLKVADEGLCFGRIDTADGERTYVGRVGLFDEEADWAPLLTDWRAPAARPFYTATAARPEGVVLRRHFHTRGRFLEGFHDDELDMTSAALLAAVNAPRAEVMRDIVATIQAEQDRIIRTELNGVVVVQGGPGTGKTAVALHRAAYLLYTHRRQLAKRGVLVVGPNATFLRYIGQVLPSLGETGVLLSTVGELFPGLTAVGREPAEVAALKGRIGMADVVARAIKDRQEAPSLVEVPFDQDVLRLDRRTISEARGRARRTRRPHNEARRTFQRE
ncbi:helicase, partial [Saccharothrix sp. MB29]|nr:helicase [Saccharothrix sp. MB29]